MDYTISYADDAVSYLNELYDYDTFKHHMIKLNNHNNYNPSYLYKITNKYDILNDLSMFSYNVSNKIYNYHHLSLHLNIRYKHEIKTNFIRTTGGDYIKAMVNFNLNKYNIKGNTIIYFFNNTYTNTPNGIDNTNQLNRSIYIKYYNDNVKLYSIQTTKAYSNRYINSTDETITERFYKLKRNDYEIHNTIHYNNHYVYKEINYENRIIGHDMNFNEYGFHNDHGPAMILYHPDGSVKEELYYLNGIMHNEHGPAKIAYHSNGNIRYECYYDDNLKHRSDGLAEIEYYDNGKIRTGTYYINGSKQRRWDSYDDHTDIEYYVSGNIKHQICERDGFTHNPYGPAEILYYDSCIDNGNNNVKKKVYYEYSKKHRTEGPAEIEYDMDGNVIKESYFIDGLPAKIDYNPLTVIKKELSHKNNETSNNDKIENIKWKQNPIEIEYDTTGTIISETYQIKIKCVYENKKT